MKARTNSKVYLIGLAPGVGLYVAYSLLKAEALWLFVVFSFVLTLAALLFAWIFSDWAGEEGAERPSGKGTPFYRRP